MSVGMELARIISEVNDQCARPKEVEGDRTFPIPIGLFEATRRPQRKHSARLSPSLTTSLSLPSNY